MVEKKKVPGTLFLVQKAEWLLNGQRIAIGKTGEREYLWPLSRVTRLVQASVWLPGHKAVTTEEIRFVVK